MRPAIEWRARSRRQASQPGAARVQRPGTSVDRDDDSGGRTCISKIPQPILAQKPEPIYYGLDARHPPMTDELQNS